MVPGGIESGDADSLVERGSTQTTRREKARTNTRMRTRKQWNGDGTMLLQREHACCTMRNREKRDTELRVDEVIDVRGTGSAETKAVCLGE